MGDTGNVNRDGAGTTVLTTQRVQQIGHAIFSLQLCSGPGWLSTTTYCVFSALSTWQTGVERRQRSQKDWKVVEGSFRNNWRRCIFHPMKTNCAINPGNDWTNYL